MLGYDQEKAYLAAAPPNLHDVAMLILDAEMRTSEALLLQWPSVRLQPAPGAMYGYLMIRAINSKNSKPRNVPITARVREVLQQRYNATGGRGFVFQREDGSALVQTWLNEQHRALRKNLELDKEFVPHSLRHTYGTRLGESGADAFTIMKLMGHSSITISQRYVHPSPESVERAIKRFEDLNEKNRSGAGILLGIPAESDEPEEL